MDISEYKQRRYRAVAMFSGLRSDGHPDCDITLYEDVLEDREVVVVEDPVRGNQAVITPLKEGQAEYDKQIALFKRSNSADSQRKSGGAG